MWIQCCICVWMLRHLCVSFMHTHVREIPVGSRSLYTHISPLYISFHHNCISFELPFSVPIFCKQTQPLAMWPECLVTSVLPYLHSQHLVRHPALHTNFRLLEQDNTSTKSSAESTQCHSLSLSISLISKLRSWTNSLPVDVGFVVDKRTVTGSPVRTSFFLCRYHSFKTLKPSATDANLERR